MKTAYKLNQTGWTLTLLLLSLAVCGCQKSGQVGKLSNSPASEESLKGVPNQPLPLLPTVELWIGAKSLTAEVARSPIELETGMMFRTNLPAGHGMLFVFAYPAKRAFWMKNVSVPLSIAFISSEGLIMQIDDLKPFDETPVWSRDSNIQYALEVPKGWFRENGITEGMLVTTAKGELNRIDWRILGLSR